MEIIRDRRESSRKRTLKHSTVKDDDDDDDNYEYVRTPKRKVFPSNVTNNGPPFFNPDIRMIDTDFQHTMLKMFTEVQQEIKEIKQMLSTSQLQKQAIPELPQNTPELPIQTQEILEHFENMLCDESYFSHMVQFLSVIGGRTIKDCTRRILQKIISNELSLQYNWKGSRGIKLPFSKLVNVNKLVFTAVRCSHESATEVDVQTVIKQWLMHAKDRQSGPKEFSSTNTEEEMIILF